MSLKNQKRAFLLNEALSACQYLGVSNSLSLLFCKWDKYLRNGQPICGIFSRPLIC